MNHVHFAHSKYLVIIKMARLLKKTTDSRKQKNKASNKWDPLNNSDSQLPGLSELKN
jgi:hypothetical protein